MKNFLNHFLEYLNSLHKVFFFEIKTINFIRKIIFDKIVKSERIFV